MPFVDDGTIVYGTTSNVTVRVYSDTMDALGSYAQSDTAPANWLPQPVYYPTDLGMWNTVESMWQQSASNAYTTTRCHWAYVTTSYAVDAATPESMRALELLRSFLTDQQRASMDEARSFRVVGSKGRSYRLDTDSAAANVWELDDVGLEVAKLCAHPVGVPLGDQLLAQKLLIESDEDAFRAVAVEHWRRAGVAA